MKDIWNLRTTRIYNLNVIPRQFFTQAKDLRWNIDRLYALSDHICSNPANLIYVMYDEGNVIRGVLWAQINVLNENLYVILLSVDPEYQGPNGPAIEAARFFLDKIRQEANLKKIMWTTTRPRAYERHGLKRSKTVVMEA